MLHFRDTGVPSPMKSARQAAGSSTNLVAAPGAGKQIVLCDVIVVGTSNDAVIRAGSSGSMMMTFGDGHIGLTCPMGMGENKSVWPAKTGDNVNTYAIAVTYYIEDV